MPGRFGGVDREFGGEVLGEPFHEGAGHLGEGAAAELGRLSGDAEVGLHVHGGTAATGVAEAAGDEGLRGAVAARLATACLQDDDLRLLVALEEGDRAAV